jgi:hypothetical protein
VIVGAVRLFTVMVVFLAPPVPQAFVAVTEIVPPDVFGVAVILEEVLVPVQPTGKVHVYDVGLFVALVENEVAVLAQTDDGVIAEGVPGTASVVNVISAP